MAVNWGIPGGTDALSGRRKVPGLEAWDRTLGVAQPDQKQPAANPVTDYANVSDLLKLSARARIDPSLNLRAPGETDMNFYARAFAPYAMERSAEFIDQAREMPALHSFIRGETEATGDMLNRLKIRGGQAKRIKDADAAKWAATIKALESEMGGIGLNLAGLGGDLAYKARTSSGAYLNKTKGAAPSSDPWATTLGSLGEGLGAAAGFALGGPAGAALGAGAGASLGKLFGG